MKLTKMKVAFAAILMVGTVFTACSGEDGEPGAAGATGNANVSSYSYNVTAADFVGTQIKTDTIDAPEITNGLLVNGDIQSYLSFTTSDDTWHPMPYRELVFTSATTVAFENIGIRYSVGKIYLTQYTDLLLDLAIRDFTLKLVAIPSSAKIEGFEPETFKELEVVYGLED